MADETALLEMKIGGSLHRPVASSPRTSWPAHAPRHRFLFRFYVLRSMTQSQRFLPFPSLPGLPLRQPAAPWRRKGSAAGREHTAFLCATGEDGNWEALDVNQEMYEDFKPKACEYVDAQVENVRSNTFAGKVDFDHWLVTSASSLQLLLGDSSCLFACGQAEAGGLHATYSSIEIRTVPQLVLLLHSCCDRWRRRARARSQCKSNGNGSSSAGEVGLQPRSSKRACRRWICTEPGAQ